MKHLLITLDFPPQTGGVAGYYAHLTQAMRKSGEEVLVLAQGIGEERGVIRKKLINPWVNPHWFPILWQVWKRRKQYDRIWVGQILPVGTAVWLVSFLFPLRYVVFCHGMDVAQLKGRKKWLAKQILSRAKIVVCNSRYTQGFVQALGVSEKKIHIVYPCPAVQGFLQEPSQKRILLTVCRLVTRKGVDTVLRALPLIRQAFPEVQYVVAGEGPAQEGWQKLAEELKVSDKVTWKGRVSDAELKQLYTQAQIFVMTPKEEAGDVEGFGMVYLEANCFGLPVVGTNTGGVSEAIEDEKTGIMVQNTPESVASGIIRLFKDDALRHTLGKQGYARVMQQFQWEKQAKIVKAIL